MNLVPIKVKIGLRANGQADHPDWYQLPLAETVEPATLMSSGWHYDKSCGHKENRVDSPIGMQWGMLLVTPLFAQEALTVFPELVFEMNEVEAEDFWENKHTVQAQENKADTNILQALESELALRTALEQDVTDLKVKIVKALDPNDVEPGLKKNHMKKFVDAKQVLDINVVASL